MFKIIKRILLTNKSNTYLGRWNVDKPVEVINKTIDWSNHDHCGSELCNLLNNKEKEIKEGKEIKEERKKIKEEKEIKKTNQIKKDNYDFDNLELLYLNKDNNQLCVQ